MKMHGRYGEPALSGKICPAEIAEAAKFAG
jgi:hypothetical protein